MKPRGFYSLPLFLSVSVVVLTAVGILKIVAALDGSSHAIEAIDPILGLKNRHVFFLVGAIEISLAIYIISSPDHLTGYCLVAGLGCNFLAYRVLMFVSGVPIACPCLGGLYRFLNISPHLADTVAKGILAFLLIGGAVNICLSVLRPSFARQLSAHPKA